MSSATQNCEFCSSPAHVWFNCTKKPDGWKPDRLKAASLAEAQPDVVPSTPPAGHTKRGRPLSPDPKSPRAAYQRKLMRERRAKVKT